MGGPDPPWEGAILVDRGAHCKGRWRHLSNNIEPSVYGGETPYDKLL